MSQRHIVEELRREVVELKQIINNQQRIIEEQRQYYERIIEEQRQYYERIIEEQRQHYERIIEEQRQHYEHEIGQLREQLASQGRIVSMPRHSTLMTYPV